MLLFRGSNSKNSPDYPSKMNWNVLSYWCQHVVFPVITRTGHQSVFVLNSATYHTVLDDEDRFPTTSWNKNKFQDSIMRWGGPPEVSPLNWKEHKTRAQLLAEAKRIYPSLKYKIQKIEDEFETETFPV